jgi:PleD family two-component response regulator
MMFQIDKKSEAEVTMLQNRKHVIKIIKPNTMSLVIGMLAIISCTKQSKHLMGHGEKVLVIGRHESMLAKVTDMLKQHNYQAVGRQSNEEAIAAFKSDTFDAVIIGGGVDAESRNLFHAEFPKINPQVKIINGHPQTVLSDLQQAFGNR